MLCEVPLTKEQQAFATDHHGLVYKFLNENHLPEDEFYDVVVFAYLKAVKDYFNSPSAQKFSFSTIATRQMKFRLYDNHANHGLSLSIITLFVAVHSYLYSSRQRGYLPNSK